MRDSDIESIYFTPTRLQRKQAIPVRSIPILSI